MMELTALKGIGPATKQKLELLGVTNVRELLYFLPRAYIDMSAPSELTGCNPGEYRLFRAKVGKVFALRRGRRGMSSFRAEASGGGIKVEMTWYNQPYMREKLAEGTEYTFFGKLLQGEKGLMVNNPVFEPAEGEKKLKGIVPIYKTGGLIHQSSMRGYIKQALEYASVVGLMPEEAGGLNEALAACHNPESIEEGKASAERVVLEDVYNTIINYRIVRKESSVDKGRLYKNSDIAPFQAVLPYELTVTQKAAISDIIKDFKSKEPMNRLLLGDVGSGKTAVAMAAAYVTAMNGYQAAILAPTAILAAQHFKSSEPLKRLGINVRLLTADTPARERAGILKELNSGEAGVVIGTHSLLNGEVKFRALGLAVTDEQHRFGVSQKNEMELKGPGADVLVMSATPIPRALALMMYDDLAVSRIERRAKNEVKTSIVPPEKTADMYAFIRSELDAGRQAFIVCPRVEDEEGIELVSAEGLYKTLKTGEFKGYRLGLVHGSLPADKKEAVMREFAAGAVQALVCTTVIEVGIDVPNATVMAVFDAYRFGLATLHQLRGRVGRGEYRSYCLLCSGRDTERLSALKKSSDGLEIAETDYDIRGGGDFIGLRQSGREGERYPIPVTRAMILKAKELADKTVIDAAFIKRFNSVKREPVDRLVRKVTMN